jgi:hypothetical protein
MKKLLIATLLLAASAAAHAANWAALDPKSGTCTPVRQEVVNLILDSATRYGHNLAISFMKTPAGYDSFWVVFNSRNGTPWVYTYVDTVQGCMKLLPAAMDVWNERKQGNPPTGFSMR